MSNADIHGVTQGTVSRIVKKVSKLLCTHIAKFIKFPNNLTLTKQQFCNIRNFPGVIGCVDGTHIPINQPGGAVGEIFRNRKGTFSLNVQVTGGPNLEIFDIVCRWPGSAHDSRIFHNSALKNRLENGTLRGILLGDSGYPQLPYIFTPFLRPGNDYEERYNVAHIQTRNTVERLFGVWKRRFPCLFRKFYTKLENTTLIISAVAILHNIAILVNDEHDYEDEVPYQQPPPVHFNNNQLQGNVIKQRFARVHFRR